MCGIAGVLTREPDARADGEALRTMQDALRHRGPDDRGEWRAPSGWASFAHTRLSIFDPTAAGRQPMTVDGGRFTIVYNGAIYNFLELRRQLEADGERFDSRTDTEVIVRLYARHGVSAFARLRGMFALAIWDDHERTCVLARDRFGIKPLYFSRSTHGLLFASEVRALVAGGVPRELDPEGVYRYFKTGSVPEPLTILAQVRSVGAGQYVRWVDGRVSEAAFATLRIGDSDADRQTAADVRDALRESIAAHFEGDVPVGLFLSGGIDSSALAALRPADRALHTFSMSLPATADDEGPVARRTAGHFGAIHHECVVDAATARAALPEFVRSIDQPSIDGFNTFMIARLAASHGMKAVMSGIGADELFGGYPTFQGVPWLASWHERAAKFGALAPMSGRLVEAWSPTARARRLGDLMQQRPGGVAAYAAYRGIFTRREASLLTEAITGQRPAEDLEPEALPAGDIDGDMVTTLELTRYVRNQLLRDSDAMSMAFGVELRTPYLDAPLLDAVSAVPAGVRLEPGKAFMKRMVPELPSWVVNRPKQCFQFPFDDWLGAEWKDLFSGNGRRFEVATDTWYRKWSVFVLESWMKNLRISSHA